MAEGISQGHCQCGHGALVHVYASPSDQTRYVCRVASCDCEDYRPRRKAMSRTLSEREWKVEARPDE